MSWPRVHGDTFFLSGPSVYYVCQQHLGAASPEHLVGGGFVFPSKFQKWITPGEHRWSSSKGKALVHSLPPSPRMHVGLWCRWLCTPESKQLRWASQQSLWCWLLGLPTSPEGGLESWHLGCFPGPLRSTRRGMALSCEAGTEAAHFQEGALKPNSIP